MKKWLIKEILWAKEIMRLTPKEWMLKMCECLGCDFKDVRQVKRGRENQFKRAYIYVGRQGYKISGSELARELNVSHAAISQHYYLAEKNVREKSGCCELIVRLSKFFNLQRKV